MALDVDDATSGLDPFLLAAKSWKLIGGAEALRGLVEECCCCWSGPFLEHSSHGLFLNQKCATEKRVLYYYVIGYDLPIKIGNAFLNT